MKTNRAFTLVELLVVIAIIGILSTIVLANLATARAQSRDAKRISDINTLQLAAQLYYDKCNQYPTSSGNVPNLASSAGCPSGFALNTFISSIPTPPGGGTYYYIVNSTWSDFYLGIPLENTGHSVLIDDVDGTVGVANNWTGYGNGTFSAADPVYTVTSK